MRVVTAGIGLRAGHVLSLMKEAMPEMQIVGFYDPQPTHLEMIGTDTPRFDSVEAMLSDTRPDLFFVGSPNRFHLEQIRAGLEAGVRVFTEKPVVVTRQETMELAELLARHGPDRVMVGLVLRYSQHMVDLRAALAAGALGPIASIEANEHIAPYHGAFFMRDWRRRTDLFGRLHAGKVLPRSGYLQHGHRPRARSGWRALAGGGRSSPNTPPPGTPRTRSSTSRNRSGKASDDPFRSTGDIIDFQTAILSYESGASLSFHTNLNVPDEHRRFCVIGRAGMAEGDFVRGYLRVTRRDGSRFADHDYTRGDPKMRSAHYGADHMMVADIAAFLRGETAALPVGILDAMEAGLAALALDEARVSGQVVDLTETWAELDGYGLRR